MKGVKYYTESLIKESFKEILENDYTLYEAEEKIAIPRSTLSWWFRNKLLDIDREMFEEVMIMFANHEHQIRKNKR